MQYITAAQAAEKWDLTVRRVQDLCRSNAIDGVVRWGRDWMIPADAHRPTDRRRRNTEQASHPRTQLPRKNPYLSMSNIYHVPGSADAVVKSYEQERPAAAKLLQAQIAYHRGNFDEASRLAEELLDGVCGHDLQIGCGLVLAPCALLRSDAEAWRRAEQCIRTAPCYGTRDKCAVDFWLASIHTLLRETKTFPIWFMRGDFTVLPGDSYPGARYYYLRYLYLIGHGYALGQHGQPDAQERLRLFTCVAEPLISQNHKEGALVSEIYTRLLCACAYHDLGNDNRAISHLDIAIRLAVPDKLYMILAQYRRQLDFLMDDRLSEIDPSAVAPVRNLSKRFIAGWTEIHNHWHGARVTNQLTTREREVAKQAAFGLSNKEIAQRLGISVNTVKQSLRTAMDKTGALRRSDIAAYL